MVEEAADRVFMAARLFVRLFNHHRGTLQTHILELLSLADAADSFHKRTFKDSVGSGVASVAGSVTTITGLVQAPLTMGTSLIVTAVGIGVATAETRTCPSPSARCCGGKRSACAKAVSYFWVQVKTPLKVSK